jgi:sec-independent protein translocase protein TatB
MAGAGLTGFLQNLSGSELIVILIVALVVLGPERLPELARGAGRAIHKLKTMTEGLQSEVRDVMDDPSMQPLKELGELAARPRQKLTEYALEAEAEERARREAAAHAEHQAAIAAADAESEPASDAESEPASDAESGAEPPRTGDAAEDQSTTTGARDDAAGIGTRTDTEPDTQPLGEPDPGSTSVEDQLEAGHTPALDGGGPLRP